MLEIALGVFGALAVAFGFWALMVRVKHKSHLRAIRDAVQAYVDSHGGSVEFDEEGAFVKGELGEGRVTFRLLQVTCPANEPHRWETSIGGRLSEYIPDEIYKRQSERATAEAEKAAEAFAALPDEELRTKLRARIVSRNVASGDVAVCARPLSQDFEVRVVLDGVEAPGLPHQVRTRLSDADGALVELALAQSLGAPPQPSDESVVNLLWLSRIREIFGASPYFLAAKGEELLWTQAKPDGIVGRLHRLAAAAGNNPGPLRGVLWTWDGEALSSSTIVVHSILGPTTPEYEIQIPNALRESLGLPLTSERHVGLRRAG